MVCPRRQRRRQALSLSASGPRSGYDVGGAERQGCAGAAASRPPTNQRCVALPVLFDSELFQEVVSAACLEQDLQILPAGSQTEIGERGVTLSGGQKARICFARALNRVRAAAVKPEIVFLDSPLAAVDVHVGEQLFDCIQNGTGMRETTRVLATNQLQFLKHVDHVIALKDGKVEFEGSYVDFLEAGLEISGLAKAQASSSEDKAIDASKDVPAPVAEKDKEGQEGSGGDAKTTSTEEAAIGSVLLDVYLSTIRNAGGTSKGSQNRFMVIIWYAIACTLPLKFCPVAGWL